MPEKRYVQIQLPSELVEKLKALAAEENRTLPQEISRRLVASLAEPPDISDFWYGSDPEAQRVNRGLALVTGYLANKLSAIAGDISNPNVRKSFLGMLIVSFQHYLLKVGAADHFSLPDSYKQFATMSVEELMRHQRHFGKRFAEEPAAYELDHMEGARARNTIAPYLRFIELNEIFPTEAE